MRIQNMRPIANQLKELKDAHQLIYFPEERIWNDISMGKIQLAGKELIDAMDKFIIAFQKIFQGSFRVVM